MTSYDELPGKDKWELELLKMEFVAINTFFAFRRVDPVDLAAVRDMHIRVRSLEETPRDLRNREFLAELYDTRKWDPEELKAFAATKDMVEKGETLPGVELEGLKRIIEAKSKLLRDPFYRILTAELYMTVQPALRQFYSAVHG